MTATTSARRGHPALRATGVVALPAILLALLLWGLWNPAARLPEVRAAIVNHDEPVTVDGQLVPLGRQLAAELVGSDSDMRLQWEITDAAGAANGLEDGTYTAAVVIPEDFSAAATSFSDAEEARKAVVEVTTAEGGRDVDALLARAVADSTARVLGEQLTETYVENVLVGFTTLSEKLGGAADGAGQLADGVGRLQDGTSQLVDGAGAFVDGTSQLADGAGQLASGASRLASGTSQLLGGARRLDGGAAQLADGAGQLADGARQSAGGAKDLATGTRRLADGAGQLAGGAGDIATGAARLADGAGDIAGGAGQLADGAARLAGGLDALRTETSAMPAEAEQLLQAAAGVAEGLQTMHDELADRRSAACEAEPGSATCESLTEQLDQVAGLLGGAQLVHGGVAGVVGTPASATSAPTGMYRLVLAIDQLAGDAAEGTGAAGLAAGAADLAEGANGLADGAGALADGTADLAAGAADLADGAGQLADGASQLAGGLGRLSSGAGDLAKGTGDLAQGTGELLGGVSGLHDGAGRLASGTGGLADGAAALADGANRLTEGLDEATSGVGRLADGASQLAEGLDQAVEEIPSYDDDARSRLSETVASPVTTEASVGRSGTPAALAVLALWLGALATFVVLPAVPSRTLGSTRSAAALAGRALRVPALLALAQGVVVGLVLGRVLEAGAGERIGLLVLAVAASLAFVVLNQAAAALFGDLGRGTSLAVAVVVVATALVGTAPHVLVGLESFLPVGPARQALLAVLGAGGSVGWSVLALAAWAGLAFAATALGVARSRRSLATRVVARS